MFSDESASPRMTTGRAKSGTLPFLQIWSSVGTGSAISCSETLRHEDDDDEADEEADGPDEA